MQQPLSEDTSAGVVRDREGTAARKPVLSDRWSPADAHARVALGDWLKTGARGANALAVGLAGGGELVLGPGTLLEVTSSSAVRLVRGELRVEASPEAVVAVAGPGEGLVRVDDRRVLRASGSGLEMLQQDPRWLVGYESDASTEALGSLLASVDGRDVPLTLGYHKVTVDIRDQIARTVVEESFVNHTDMILEGIFYFPLPADASISSFGMWIGDELVQGDIVEKQRAREIYETILRERRDPGLLEWSGGNLFKARVYPIAGEKRIRIAYTQVLPKNGDTYEYHYALQSELLRKTPLRRLQIEVNVASAATLASVVSPSHECRVRTTEHASRVEFEAEEYTPDRDFELRVRSAGGEFGITAAPHRRGDDGYFMLLVDTPSEVAGAGGGADEPLDVLVVADTSGSTWGAPRAAQIAFVEALFGALSERDTINLMTADTRAEFAFERARPAAGGAVDEALTFLERRDPLGWSDLDRAFERALERAGPRTHVVYVGDGSPTAGAADPVATAQHVQRIHAERGATATFHAVTPGNLSEPIVLRALSGLGGGSARSFADASAAAGAAFDLLAEIASPAVKGLSLSFEGLEVGAVYPSTLPNLPLGRQQVVVGRFDPEGGALRGRVVVRGTVGGSAVEFASELDLDLEDGAGNSFVPRLWARRHLDHLLDQGASSVVRERIIALSEDYQIITPYTSFLVLESDADRERFAVERRIRMRDGEEFFTEGRDDARHELLRQQMLAAKTWRRELRAEVLRELAKMGRELTEHLRGDPSPMDRNVALGQDSDLRYAARGGPAKSNVTLDGSIDFRTRSVDESAALPESLEEFEEPLPMEEDADNYVLGRQSGPSGPSSPAPRTLTAKRAQLELRGGLERGWMDDGRYERFDGPYRPYDPLEGLFPPLADPRQPAGETTWPLEVAELLARLDRRAALAASDRPWSFARSVESSDSRGRTQASAGRLLLAPDRWAADAIHLPGMSYLLTWCDARRRGQLEVGWNLGRTRAARAGDLASWPAPFEGAFGDFLQPYSGWTARLEPGEDGRVLVRFTRPTSDESAYVLEIDPQRAVLVERRWMQGDEVTWRATYGGFREVGGLWWPSEERTWSRESPAHAVTRIDVAQLDAAALEARWATTLAPRDEAILLDGDAPELVEAKQVVQAGEAGSEERWVLLRHWVHQSRYDLARPHLDALADLEKGRVGLDLIRATYLQVSRDNEALREHLLATAARLVARPRAAEYAMAMRLLGLASTLEQGIERLELLRAVEPVIARCEGVLDARYDFESQVYSALSNLGRPDEAFAALTKLAEDYPHRAQLQRNYALDLARRGRVDDALSWLGRSELRDGPWTDHEIQTLRQGVTDILWDARRLVDLVSRFDFWERERVPHSNGTLLGQYLTALVLLDRENEAWERVRLWTSAYARDDLESFERERLRAAVQLALGRAHGFSAPRIDEDRARLLAETVRALAPLTDADPAQLVQQILSDYRFRRTDAGLALQAELFRQLVAEVATLDAQRIERQAGWVRSSGYEPEAPASSSEPVDPWHDLMARVYERWKAEEEGPGRLALQRVVTTWGERELVLRLRRAALARATEPTERRAAADALFQALLQAPWSSAHEEELFATLPLLTDAASTSDGDLRRWIMALYDLVGWLPDARAQAEVAASPEFTTLSRRALAAERDGLLRRARLALAARLEGLSTTLEPESLRPWAAIDRIYLSVLAGDEARVAAARDAALALLRRLEQEPAATGAEDGADTLPARILATRSAATVAHVLARGGALADEGVESAFRAVLEGRVGSDASLVDARELLFALLVALDRGDELEATLAAWYGDGTEFSRIRWGRDLAHVFAERGELEQAIETLLSIDRPGGAGGAEGASESGELDHDDLRALSDWYTALDRPAEARRARVRSWEALGEYALSRKLNEALQPYTRPGDGPPPELDPEVPLQWIALLRKASYPQNYVYWLQRAYGYTNDFRLLEALPEAVLGQSAMRVYPLLTGLARLTGGVFEEAAFDRLHGHVEELRSSRDLTGVDRRALALLEFQALHMAADQTHGVEDAERRALAALQAAGRADDAWTEGEPTLMAAFLENLGAVRSEAVGAEQLRQLRALQAVVEHPQDRFVVAGHYARTLHAHGRREDAVRTLAGALDALRAARGQLPPEANDELQALASWHVEGGAYRAAEALWDAELRAAPLQTQTRWLELRRFELYRDAVLARADLALGAGPRLYDAVHERFLDALFTPSDEMHVLQVVAVLCDLWTRAHQELELERIPADVVHFAFTDLPRVLDAYQYRNGQQSVSSVERCLVVTSGSLTALEFLVVRAETEPSWLELQGQDFWARHAYTLGQRRSEVGERDAVLSDRVLAIVLRELRRDQETRVQRRRTMYDVRQGDFWARQRKTFHATALEVLSQREDSGASVVWIADYLFRGLEAHDDAIDALQRARARGLLDFEGRRRLASFLQELQRWRESVPVLVELVRDAPSEVVHHTMLMKGYHGTGQRVELQRALDAAKSWFQERNRWQEAPIAALAEGCYETELWQDCAALYDEAIALHVRSAPGRGVGDGQLAGYYRNLASAHAGLGDTDAAVDAAAGAVVSWGDRTAQRGQELDRLKQVLVAAEDLDAYVARLDAESAATGLENPILRKALGQAYIERRARAKAVPQLRNALELQPYDFETYELLAATLEDLSEPEGAADVVLEHARAAGSDIDLFRRLGEKYARIGGEGADERALRAFTSAVEAHPNESESHAMLAEVFEERQRFDDAARHWRHVIRVRTDEPTGYLGLARTLVRQERGEEAREVLRELRSRKWDSRFGDVRAEADALERALGAR